MYKSEFLPGPDKDAIPLRAILIQLDGQHHKFAINYDLTNPNTPKEQIALLIPVALEKRHYILYLDSKYYYVTGLTGTFGTTNKNWTDALNTIPIDWMPEETNHYRTTHATPDLDAAIQIIKQRLS